MVLFMYVVSERERDEVREEKRENIVSCKVDDDDVDDDFDDDDDDFDVDVDDDDLRTAS